MTIKGPTKSVYIVNDDGLRSAGGRWKLQSGKAIRVRGYTEDTLGDKKVYGGDALPVYVLDENDIRSNGGDWILQAGEAIPVTSAIGAARGVQQGVAIPVYPVLDDGVTYDSDFAGAGVSAYTTKVLGYGPIAYWILGEAAGLTAVEQIDTPAQDGTYGGGETLGQPGIGDGNTAPFFDGTGGGYVNIHTANFVAAFDGDEGSYNIWFKMNSAAQWTDNNKIIINLFDDNNNFVRLWIRSATGNLAFQRKAGGTNKTHEENLAATTNWVVAGLSWSTIANQQIAYAAGAPVNTVGALNNFRQVHVLLRLEFQYRLQKHQ